MTHAMPKSHRHANLSASHGFTLIELLVVVAIIAILASVAIPSYSDYTRRARAGEATATLSTWRSQMEQYYLDNRNYGTGACGKTAPPAKHFTMSCALTNGGQGFTLTATASISGEGTYTLDEANQQKTTQFKGASTTKSCWLIRGSEC